MNRFRLWLYRQSTRFYHRWYYDSKVWQDVRFLGVKSYKSVSDMWNYQEILFELKPSLVVEFGTRFGGSALYFEMILGTIASKHRVLTVDIDRASIDPAVLSNPNIEFVQSSSVVPNVAARIAELRNEYPGPVFFILDSDHSKEHVLQELILLKGVTRADDYVVVEDSNVNGHPVLPKFGPGPYEAIAEYVRRFPDDYRRDTERERKFGFTFAPRGFLVRRLSHRKEKARSLGLAGL